MSGSRDCPPIVTRLLLTGPFVPNIERLLDRHDDALAIAKKTPFEAYETSITLPHAGGLLRFQLVESALTDEASVAPDHNAQLLVTGSWLSGTARDATRRQAIVIGELLDQAGGAVAVAWGDAILDRDTFIRLQAGESLPDPESDRAPDVGGEPEREGWFARLLGRKR
jgi:hypothetical protein